MFQRGFTSWMQKRQPLWPPKRVPAGVMAKGCPKDRGGCYQENRANLVVADENPKLSFDAKHQDQGIK